MILFADFHVHFWLLLSKRVNLKGSSAKKYTSTDNVGVVWRPLCPPCSGGHGFLVNIAKFWRTPILKNIWQRLLLMFLITTSKVPKCASWSIFHMNICKILIIILKNVFNISNMIYTHTTIKIYLESSTCYVLLLVNFIIHQVTFCSKIFWIFWLAWSFMITKCKS